MSTVRFIERDGQRVELTSADDIKSELRCDGCGEYLAASNRISVAIRIDFDPSSPVMSVHDFNVDAHRPHVAAAIATVLAGLDPT